MTNLFSPVGITPAGLVIFNNFEPACVSSTRSAKNVLILLSLSVMENSVCSICSFSSSPFLGRVTSRLSTTSLSLSEGNNNSSAIRTAANDGISNFAQRKICARRLNFDASLLSNAASPLKKASILRKSAKFMQPLHASNHEYVSAQSAFCRPRQKG